MSNLSTDEEYLRGELHAAALSQLPFEAPLDRIRRRLRANVVGLGLRDSGTGRPFEVLGRINASLDAAEQYSEHFYAVDFVAHRALLQPGGKPVSSDALAERRELHRSEVFNDWMLPNDMERYICFWAPMVEGPRVAAGFHRPQGSVAFDSDDIAFIEQCVEPLRHAASVYLRLRPFDGDANRLLHHVPHAALLLDDEKCCVGLNPAAELLVQKDVVQVRSGHIRFPAVAREAWDRVRRLGTGSFFVPGTKGHGSLSATLLSLSWPVQRSWFLLELRQPHARVFQAPMAQDDFKLTAAETRLASYLVQGHSLEKVSQLTRVSRGTLRTQLKALHRKVECQRQGELVAKLSRYCF